MCDKAETTAHFILFYRSAREALRQNKTPLQVCRATFRSVVNSNKVDGDSLQFFLFVLFYFILFYFIAHV